MRHRLDDKGIPNIRLSYFEAVRRCGALYPLFSHCAFNLFFHGIALRVKLLLALPLAL